MGWDLLISIGIPLVKWLFQLKAKKKLSDKEFLEHIAQHQVNRSGTGKSAREFDDAMEEARQALKDAKKKKEEESNGSN